MSPLVRIETQEIEPGWYKCTASFVGVPPRLITVAYGDSPQLAERHLYLNAPWVARLMSDNIVILLQEDTDHAV